MPRLSTIVDAPLMLALAAALILVCIYASAPEKPKVVYTPRISTSPLPVIPAIPLNLIRTTAYDDVYGCWGDRLQAGDCALPMSYIVSGLVKRDDYVLLIKPDGEHIILRVRDYCGIPGRLDVWHYCDLTNPDYNQTGVKAFLLRWR